MKGLVIKKNADLFSVECNGQVFNLKPRGNMKKDGVFVGDVVQFDKTIDRVEQRKNVFIRPPLANVDKIFIVISPTPKPDFLLVDKIILLCLSKGVTPVIVLNKEDISDQDFIREVKRIYKGVAKVLTCSAVKGQINSLRREIKGITAFAGQSAVGKSSLINSLLKENLAQVGDISKKIQRGKQTTRAVSLFKIGSGYIADTAGFSSLEIGLTTDLDAQEISKYYPDFLPYLDKCKYRTCNHKKKGECAIIDNVEKGKINQIRYQNYLKIFDSLSQFRSKYR